MKEYFLSMDSEWPSMAPLYQSPKWNQILASQIWPSLEFVWFAFPVSVSSFWWCCIWQRCHHQDHQCRWRDPTVQNIWKQSWTSASSRPHPWWGPKMPFQLIFPIFRTSCWECDLMWPDEICHWWMWLETCKDRRVNTSGTINFNWFTPLISS